MHPTKIVFTIALAAGLASFSPGHGWAQTAAPATSMPGMQMPATKPVVPTAKPVVPVTKPVTPAAVMAPININTATADQLDAIPQIGPKRAAKIIAGRPYKTVNDLVTKKVLTPKLFDKIKTHFVV